MHALINAPLLHRHTATSIPSTQSILEKLPRSRIKVRPTASPSLLTTTRDLDLYTTLTFNPWLATVTTHTHASHTQAKTRFLGSKNLAETDGGTDRTDRIYLAR